MRVITHPASSTYFRGLAINATTIFLVGVLDPIYGQRLEWIPFILFIAYYLFFGVYLSYRLVRGMDALEAWFDLVLKVSLPVAVYYGYLSIQLPVYAPVVWIWGTTVGMPGFGFVRRRYWLVWILVLFAATLPGFFTGAFGPRSALWMVWMVIMTYYMTEASNRLKRMRKEHSQVLVQTKKQRRDLSVAHAKQRAAAERIRSELDLAGRLQRQLLPPLSGISPRFKICERYLAMENVGGDFYDVVKHGDSLFLLLADVTGHGVAASLITTMTKAAFHNQRFPAGPGEILTGMNRDLCRFLGGGHHFVSAICAVLDPERGQLVCANAGHPPAIYLSDSIVKLGDDNLILGVDPGSTWNDQTLSLRAGDRILFYTDGVTETRSDDFDMYDARLLEQCERLRSLEPEEFLESLLLDLERFRGPVPQTDDIAIICVDFTG